MLEINQVLKIKQFLVVINFCLSEHVQMLELNEVVKTKKFLVVINLGL